jgi:CBS domain containing-hemolysin-like protein
MTSNRTIRDSGVQAMHSKAETVRLRPAAWALALAALPVATPALASHGSPETVDKIANFIAWVVICIVPIIGIAVFWMVHVLPEKVAHKRHHPQKDAIQVLCLLSLVFGGLLWPLAWLWAYSKPVLHQLAYGTDKHEDYFAHAVNEEKSLPQDVTRLREELDRLVEQGNAPEELAGIRDQLAALEPLLASRASTEGAG